MTRINLREKDRKLLAAIIRGCGLKDLGGVGYSRDGADKRIRALCRQHGLPCRAALVYWVGRQGLLGQDVGGFSPLNPENENVR